MKSYALKYLFFLNQSATLIILLLILIGLVSLLALIFSWIPCTLAIRKAHRTNLAELRQKNLVTDAEYDRVAALLEAPDLPPERLSSLLHELCHYTEQGLNNLKSYEVKEKQIDSGAFSSSLSKHLLIYAKCSQLFGIIFFLLICCISCKIILWKAYDWRSKPAAILFFIIEGMLYLISAKMLKTDKCETDESESDECQPGQHFYIQKKMYTYCTRLFISGLFIIMLLSFLFS